jgi:hypothetical protein
MVYQARDKMTNARRDGLYLVILGIAVFLLMGLALENAAPVATADFRVVYYSARCLLEHHDPYSERELDAIYHAEGGESPQDTPSIRLTERQYIYLPTAFPLTIFFALFPFGTAHFLWLGLTGASLIVAAVLIWDTASASAPALSGFLVGLLLASCELYLALGNPGGIAIGLCVIAAWCFVRERYVVAGTLCMALSLMLKPHDSGLIWLCFLLAGGSYRRRAVQTLAVILLLSVPAVVWVWHVQPNWFMELQANLVGNGAHGSLSDPGPKSSAGHGIGMMINLQTAISMFDDDPKIYNPASYLIAGILFLLWIAKILRLQPRNDREIWFAIAPIAALSMLPLYHRLYDAKLLILSIPACAMLWLQGGVIAWVAVLLNLGAIVLTSGFFWAIFLRILPHLSIPSSILVAAQVLPVPGILLVSAVFYLWIFLRQKAQIRL